MPRQRQQQSAAPKEDEPKDCKELKMSHMAQTGEAGRQDGWRLGTKRETNKQVKIVINIKLLVISTCRRKFLGSEREMRASAAAPATATVSASAPAATPAPATSTTSPASAPKPAPTPVHPISISLLLTDC